jgi:hypothetical protein
MIFETILGFVSSVMSMTFEYPYGDHAPDLIEILRRENISRSALMPTMDDVAENVRRNCNVTPMCAEQDL